MAGRIFHAGSGGSGQAAKIANNMMLGINLAALCEGSVLAGRLGLDPKTFFEIASVSSGDSWALRNWYPVEGVVANAAVNRDFQGGFAVDLMRKDVGLALEAGGSTATDLPFAALVVQYLDKMVEASAVCPAADAGLKDMVSKRKATHIRNCGQQAGTATGSMRRKPYA